MLGEDPTPLRVVLAEWYKSNVAITMDQYYFPSEPSACDWFVVTVTRGRRKRTVTTGVVDDAWEIFWDEVWKVSAEDYYNGD